MTPPQKPEWIKIAEKDISISPRKVSKGLPVMALVVTASILGVGAIFGQTAEKSPASALEVSSPAVQSAATVSTGNIETNSANSSNNQAAVSTSKVAIVPSITSNASSMKNPSIGSMPTGGSDDDDEDEFGDEDEGDDDEGDDD